MSKVVGCIKDKSAIHLARVYGEPKRNFVGQHFQARGDFALNRFERLTDFVPPALPGMRYWPRANSHARYEPPATSYQLVLE